MESNTERPNNNPKFVAEPKMPVDALTQAPTNPLTVTQQILLWLNGLTLPAIVYGAIKGTRWFDKKEELVKSTVSDFQSSLNTIRDNHLHTIQESLKEMQKSQGELVQVMAEQTKEIVQAQNVAKDAIVQAILTAARK